MYKGITTHSETPDPKAVLDILFRQPRPVVDSWRAIVHPKASYLWEVKPPGRWVSILRHDELLVTTDPAIPLDVDYAHVFEMLKVHGAALLARLDSEFGLIAVAVSKPNEPFTPLIPGYHASALVDTTSLTLEGIEQLSERGYEWPEGLQKPSIIGMQAALALSSAEHRTYWLKACPEGLWLLSTASRQALTIYEVL
jgi:hypothetical protein